MPHKHYNLYCFHSNCQRNLAPPPKGCYHLLQQGGDPGLPPPPLHKQQWPQSHGHCPTPIYNTWMVGWGSPSPWVHQQSQDFQEKNSLSSLTHHWCLSCGHCHNFPPHGWQLPQTLPWLERPCSHCQNLDCMDDLGPQVPNNCWAWTIHLWPMWTWLWQHLYTNSGKKYLPIF